MLDRLLAHPLTRGLDLDSPATTALRREIVKTKPFLSAVYNDWYRMITDAVPQGEGTVLELGSGGGYLSEVLPESITSEIFEVPGVDMVVDARQIPFADGELKAIVMTNVFHHIPDVTLFLSEARRVLRTGGRIVMVEPWNTGWSRFVHRKFHNEPMLTGTSEWGFPESGPLSGANAALAWIVVERDRGRLERQWPELAVARVEPFMPFRYIVSGGVSLRSLQPGWLYPLWKKIDESRFLREHMSLFAFIVIERQ